MVLSKPKSGFLKLMRIRKLIQILFPYPQPRDTHQLFWILISSAGQIRKPYPPNNPPKFLSTSFLVSCMQHASFLPMQHMNIYMQPMHAALFAHACMQHHTLLLSFFFLSSFEQLVPVLDGARLGLPLLVCSGTGAPMSNPTWTRLGPGPAHSMLSLYFFLGFK